MDFSVNHPLLFLIAGILIAVVLAQSVFFLVKAMRRSKELGMDQSSSSRHGTIPSPGMPCQPTLGHTMSKEENFVLLSH